MRRTGTLKAEIVKPERRAWKECGNRMHVTANALAAALNATMRELYPAAQAQIEQKRNGVKKADQSWQGDARKILREKWATEMARALAYAQKSSDPDPAAYLPVESATAGETVNLLLLSRFSGEHLKDLLACRASFPSWSGKQAIYTEGRACVISGSAAEARLRLPLWGTGSNKSETFVVKPAGSGHRAMWRRLVRDFARREEIVSLERRAADKKLPAEDRMRAQLALEESNACKMGRVGWKYNRKKNRWFALISWTEYLTDAVAKGDQTAAVNYGVNVFAQALAEDGADWDDSGTDIRVTRERFNGRRRSIQRALRSLGRGSRGHGRKRRYLPLTKLEGAERNWTQSRIRMHAADLIKWCVKNRIIKIVLHDLSEQREVFEKKTEGDAPEAIKRFIHSWPWYEARLAVERQAAEVGIKVELRSVAHADSITCPDCGHANAENVQIVDRGGEHKLVDGHVFREVAKESRFKCVVCGTKGRGDVVTCANMLREAGAKNPLGKMQEKSRTRTKSAVKTINRRKGNAGRSKTKVRTGRSKRSRAA